MPTIYLKYLTGPFVLAVIAVFWQYNTVQASFSGSLTFGAESEKGTRRGQTQAIFRRPGKEESSAELAQQQSSLCTDPPRGHCEFYRNCLESRLHCGEAGYPLGYGEKFCEKFVAGQDKLSPAGQKWMMDTMQCLQRVLVPDATGTSEAGSEIEASGLKDRKCDELKEKAFNSHSRCYLDNGLCSLSGRDWVHIVEIIGVKTLFDSWEAIKESIEAAEGCL